MHVSSRAKIAARAALQRAGLDLVRSLTPTDLLRRRMQLLKHHRIDVLFDVGANTGQYCATMRALGYRGRIISFEPSREAFSFLENSAKRDSAWTAVNSGMGEAKGHATLHLAANSQSSSLLRMLTAHLEAAPDAGYVGDEQVDITTLRLEIEHRVSAKERLFVKIDTQGFERQVLAGAGEGLAGILGVQLELSMVPLYDGQSLIEDLIDLMRTNGFVPMLVEPDFFDPRTGQLLQADGVFFRTAESQSSEGP